MQRLGYNRHAVVHQYEPIPRASSQRVPDLFVNFVIAVPVTHIFVEETVDQFPLVITNNLQEGQRAYVAKMRLCNLRDVRYHSTLIKRELALDGILALIVQLLYTIRANRTKAHESKVSS